jgi:D-amino-acid dehydrogenase
MRVIVLGAGVIGITSAYYLARAGHEVIVIDRQTAPAMETSFANAGQISPGYASPWAAPGVPLKAIKWLLQKHAPLAIKLDGSLAQLHWIYTMLRNCNAQRYKVNKARMVRLANYSQACLHKLRSEIPLAYEGRQYGTLQLFRTQKQLDNSIRDITVLTAAGIPHQLLNAQQITQIEPALASVREKLSGGLHLPHDETGDCFLFTTQLAQSAQQLGVQFRYHTTIQNIQVTSDSAQAITVVDHNTQVQQSLYADAFVMALSSYSTELLKPWMTLPVYPIKGYSITMPIQEPIHAPRSTLLDETYKVALTRFEQRIRVGGMAHVSGFDQHLSQTKRSTLHFVLNDLFPEAIQPILLKPDNTNVDQFWSGFRPMTPDGTPIVGPCRIKNLWLNTGHGTLGWTMACGSAALISDLISKRTPEIEADDLAITRYQ